MVGRARRVDERVGVCADAAEDTALLAAGHISSPGPGDGVAPFLGDKGGRWQWQRVRTRACRAHATVRLGMPLVHSGFHIARPLPH